jgi:hypothetical protein
MRSFAAHSSAMRLLTLSVLVFVALFVRSCGRRPAAERNQALKQETAEASERGSDADEERERREGEEAENAPESSDIGEDCVAFLRSTKIAPPKANDGTCPQCPAADSASQVLRFENVTIDRVRPSGENAEVDVHIFATFMPSRAGTIRGGLTGWIPAEQRAAYERGDTPQGQQTYAVRITYRRDANGWEPIEFSPISP